MKMEKKLPPRMNLEPRTLAGAHVRIEPVANEHREEMREALDCDPENWRMQVTNGAGADYPAYWDALIAMPNRIAYAVRHLESGRLAGTSSFLFIDRKNGTVEIGSTWFRPVFRGTLVNPECKLLMLTQAFESGALRVQFGVDSRNLRSQAACLKLGARQEGVIRRHRVTWTGHRRDSVMFSIIDDEWEAVRQRLVARLSGLP